MSKPLDWTAIETLLLDQATSGLAGFAIEHAAEVFYGAVISVADDGCVDLHLNTEQHLAEHNGKPIAAADLHGRFMPAAFAFTIPLTETDAFPSAAIEAALLRDLEEDAGADKTTSKLLDVACTVAFALEHGALTKLTRTPDFAIAVTHGLGETGESSLARYARFKNQLRAKRRSDPALIPKPNSGV